MKVFDIEGNELETHFFPNEYEFHIKYTDLTELEDLEISYIYPSKSYGGKVWLTIEVIKEDDE